MLTLDRLPRTTSLTLPPPPCPALPGPARITATILTRNSERRLDEVLAALNWCDEVVVLDDGSTDRTREIVRRHAQARWHPRPHHARSFGLAHRHAVALAANDWILSIDSDEVVSPELAAEIQRLALDPASAYLIPFGNFYGGRRITTCGWAPDRHLRLFCRQTTNFCTSAVHEGVLHRHLRTVRLNHEIRHYSYGHAGDFLTKLGSYSRLFAEEHAGRKPASMPRAVARAAWAFFRSFILQRGCLQGAEGLLISAYQAQAVFWKYVLLREANARILG
jgi:glycosyltransferase involved in cell wall biosynthesis